MTAKPIVLVDCDGVLADFQGGMLELINNTLGTKYERRHWSSYYYETALSLTRIQQVNIESALMTDKYFVASLPPLPLVQHMEELCRAAQVYVVTSPWPRHPTWASDRAAWLHQHVPWVPAKHIVQMHDKWHHHGDFLVDDKVETLAKWQAAHPRATAVKWLNGTNNEPWNGVETGMPVTLLRCVKGTKI